MFHSLLTIWFDLTLKWGYAGVFVIMAIEPAQEPSVAAATTPQKCMCPWVAR